MDYTETSAPTNLENSEISIELVRQLLMTAGYIGGMRQTDSISIAELSQMADAFDGELVKAVVDLANGKVLVDMEYHVDGEQRLLSEGSSQTDLWGFNLHPSAFGTDAFLEFDSIINLRPRQNRSRGVDDAGLRKRIQDLVARVVHN